MKILLVIGTRPNFIKVSQFKKEAIKSKNLELKIVHTGQHYDIKMADIFFNQLKIEPDFYLNIEPSSACSQVAEIMLKLEKLILNEFKADLVIVVGDVNSTVAAAMAASKLNIPIAHLESGLRSRDRSMPEEINRIVTDQLSDIFFVTENSAIENLLSEGKNSEQIYFVGNTMIDSLAAFEFEIQKNEILTTLDLKSKKYILATMHRPATVDTEFGLRKLIDIFEDASKITKIIFPIHPRTVKKLTDFNLYEYVNNLPNLILTEPLDYYAFQKLLCEAKLIITDSGGIQEETTYRKIPCLTLRLNTERPITVEIGSNILVPFEKLEIRKYISMIENGEFKQSQIPKYWDGLSTKRIIKILNNIAENKKLA